MKILNLLVILLLFTGLSFAQDVKSINKSIEISEGDKVIIELDGNVTIKKAVGLEAEIVSTFIQKGKVIGYSNKKERKKYDVLIERIGDHIWIKPKKLDNLNMLGISWYREEIEHLIYLPESIDVKISKKDGMVVIVNSLFNNLDISNEEGDIEINLVKDIVRVVTAVSNDGKITVNDERVKDMTYTLIGDGDKVVLIKTGDGDINIGVREFERRFH